MSNFDPLQYGLALIMPARVKMVPPSCCIVPMPYPLHPWSKNRATRRRRK